MTTPGSATPGAVTMRTRRMTVRAAAAAAAALLLALTAGSALAGGEPAPVWGMPVAGADSAPPSTALSCVSTTACVGVDAGGHAFSSATPVTGPWTTVDAGVSLTALNGVSCVAGGPCIAVGNAGKVTVLSAIGGTWTAHTGSIDGSNALEDVSCPTATLCVAVDVAGNGLVSADGGATWSTATSLGSTHQLSSVSCPTASFCAAVDTSGNVFVSTTPTVLPWTST